MKSKSIIGAALAAIFTLGVTTSCEDMFDIDSSRVVIDKEHTLSSTADSAYTTLGVLKCMQEIADRYIILGEVRGDMVEINEHTKTSLRNLADFNYDADNEYLDIKDYYAVINNCNYAIAKMDTTLAHNNERVMVDEYAALLGIRAWTYLQLAINYGEVPYYTNPITTVGDSEKEYPMLDVKELAAEIIPQLTPFVDYDRPVFVGTYNKLIFPVLQLVIADYYLWSGDYMNAWRTYADYMTTNKDYNYAYGMGSNVEIFRGYMGLDGSKLEAPRGLNQQSLPTLVNWSSYFSTATGSETISYIPMLTTSADGTVSEVGSLFTSTDNTHALNPSTYYAEICGKQLYCMKSATDAGNNSSTVNKKSYTINPLHGDQRRKWYAQEVQATGETEIGTFQYYDKLVSLASEDGVNIEYVTPQINIYRRSIVYLRAAEALAGVYKETRLPLAAEMSFNMLKDAYKVFFPDGHVMEEVLQPSFIGVHARGCGDTYLDTTHYVLNPDAIALRFEKEAAAVDYNDTIDYLDEMIIDELAMEATLEGNRFGDLIRFAERRGEPEFLAKRVASRKGSEQMDEELYNKLVKDKNLWYLPIK